MKPDQKSPRAAEDDDALWADLAQELHAAQQKDSAQAKLEEDNAMPAIDPVASPDTADSAQKDSSKTETTKEQEGDLKARDRLMMFSGTRSSSPN